MVYLNNVEIKKLISYYVIYLILLIGLFYYPHLSEKYLDVIKVLYLISVIPLTTIIFIPNESNFIWAKRTIIYFIVMIVSLFLSSIISYGSEYLLNINIDATNIDNARYMLSSLIQSEAAIVAIVITLTLVAVQQTSSSYSTRLIDIFRNRNPDFWILLIIYLGSITYQLIILTNLNENAISEGHIFFAFFSALFSFIALIPYMLNTIDLLKPLTMMTLLSEKISKNNILLVNSCYYNSYLSLYNPTLKIKEFDDNIKDPILPIVDIINRSLMNYDYDTSRTGLLIIRKSSILILENNDLKDEDLENIYQFFSKYFFSIGELAISKGDDMCADLVINWFYEITIILVKRQNGSIASKSISKIGKIGEFAADNKNEKTIMSTINHFDAIIYDTKEMNIEYSHRIIANSLTNIGEICAEHKIRGIYDDILTLLSILMYRAFKGMYPEEDYEEYEEEYEEYEEEYEEYIGELLKEYSKLLDKMPNDIVTLIVKGICSIGQILFEKRMTEDLENIITFLKVVINQSPKYGREDTFILANDFLKRIGEMNE